MSAIDKFNKIIDQIENRCMACDGPVTPTLQEASEEELSELWRLANEIKFLEDKVLSFRNTLSKIYKEQPFNDEGNRCCPSTVYEVITHYDKVFGQYY